MYQQPAAWLAAALALLSLLAIAAHSHASQLAPLVEESLALCAAADQVAPDAQLALLARGLDLADAAVTLDERSAPAHFAVVCNLGKATGLSGGGFGAMRAVYRLRHEIDATLTLAPDHSGALAAKGALLMKLPRWLGGDRREAEVWLRRALVVDPLNATARTYLDEIETARSFVKPAADTVIR